MAERILVVGSMSKSLFTTGSRRSWIVEIEDVNSQLVNLATHTMNGVPGSIQDAASIALNSGSDMKQEFSELVRNRRTLAIKLLSTRNVVRLVPKQGTCS